ncbi:hypothetical protein [Novosphingobium sp.]|uniref:hypothetical protein n=1 Tax=Novosphingobium sp. TaxID=1874826 RepID=UPI003BA8A5EA
MALVRGQRISSGGCISRLNWVGARAPALIEQALGYQKGRLSLGYAIGLLIEPIRANHVEFGGLTLRSGGREGAPLKDPEQDQLRVRVHTRMLQEYGSNSVARMLEDLARDPRNLTGGERIVKIYPVIEHKGDNPKEEYPMGGGGPQFILTGRHDFLIAAVVSGDCIAATAAGWSVSVAENAPYAGRERLAKYLTTATI